MKKICSAIFIFFLIPLNALALGEISLGKMPKELIEVNTTPKVVKGSLLISEGQMLDELINLQKQKTLP